MRAHATWLRALVCAYLPVCVPSAHFSREQGDVDRSAGEHQCPRAASVSRPLVPPALPPRPARAGSDGLVDGTNTTVTKEDATLQQPVTRNMPRAPTLDSGLRKNKKGQRAEDSQPSRPSSETSAGSTWTGPLPPHMGITCAANCEQRVILMTCAGTTAIQRERPLSKLERRGAPARRSSTLATPPGGNRGEGQLPLKTQKTQDRHPRPQVVPATAEADRHAHKREKRHTYS